MGLEGSSTAPPRPAAPARNTGLEYEIGSAITMDAEVKRALGQGVGPALLRLAARPSCSAHPRSSTAGPTLYRPSLPA